MVLKIELGKKKKRDFSTTKQIKVIEHSVPNFECQLDKFTKV